MRPVPLILMLAAASTGILVPATARSQTPDLYLRGVPSGEPVPEPLALTMADAVRRALEHNLGLILAEQRVDAAGGARWKALSELLPNINGRAAATRQQVNLTAFGFPLPEGVPSIAGPFNVYDARVFLSQSVFDVHALNAARAEAHRSEAARFDVRNAQDVVTRVSTNAYSQALAAAALVEASRAQRDTADALFRQATNLKQAGLVAGIDVLRAEVQLGTARQKVTASEADAEKTKLQLARLIGLPIGQAFTLADRIQPASAPDLTLDQALERAYKARGDYQAALARVDAALANRRAIVGESLPSLKVTADWGAIGQTPSEALATFAVAGAVSVPIFQGGKAKGRLLEADAELKSRRAEAEDMKAGVYYDVRTAFLDVQAGRELLEVAARGRSLAANQLTQARDRFAAGVTGNLEVVQAQESVALADDQYISALFASNLATGNLIRALGSTEEAARTDTGGTR